MANIARQHLLSKMLARFAVATNMLAKGKIPQNVAPTFINMLINVAQHWQAFASFFDLLYLPKFWTTFFSIFGIFYVFRIFISFHFECFSAIFIFVLRKVLAAILAEIVMYIANRTNMLAEMLAKMFAEMFDLRRPLVSN